MQLNQKLGLVASQNLWSHFIVWFLFGLFCFVPYGRDPARSTILATGLGIAFAFCAVASISVPRQLKSLAVSIYWVLAFLIVAVLLTYAFRVKDSGSVGPDAVRAISQTDLLEAIHYWMFSTTWEFAAAGAVVAVALVLTYPVTGSERASGLISWRSWMMAPAVAGFTIFVGGYPLVKPIYITVQKYRQELSAFRSVAQKRDVKPPSNAATEFDGTVIVIIGESTTRRHMGLYGYFRETTPLLSARSKELVVFGDVVAPHSHTVPVLTNALTLAGSEPELSFYSEGAIDIVSLAKSAGYLTYWFSNQNEFGIWDNPVSVLAYVADKTKFISPTIGKIMRRPILDHAVLPLVNEVLVNSDNGPKAVFVHPYATHGPYCDVYPESFRHFTKPLGTEFFGRAEIHSYVNCYDDAVRYVDWLIDSVIRQAVSKPEPVALIYFSDHGDAPLLGTGHESTMHSVYHVEVPFILWANEAYRARYPDVLRMAERNATRPYSLSRLFHSLGQLLQIDSDLISAQHSVLSKSYKEQNRILLNGRVKYDQWHMGNDYRENARVFLRESRRAKSKLWAHRANTLGSVMEAGAVFSGVELDIVFDDGDARFHVRHPPAPDTGLLLEDVLEATRSKPDMRLWLDWKNASPANIERAVSRLNRLDEVFQIKGRALVETGPTAVFDTIRSISAAGYLHGYYLPPDEILKCLKHCSSTQQRDLALSLEKRIKFGGFRAVTYDWRLRPFVEKWLMDFIKQENLKQFSWDLSINAARDIDRVEELIERVDDLDALLIVFPSVFKI